MAGQTKPKARRENAQMAFTLVRVLQHLKRPYEVDFVSKLIFLFYAVKTLRIQTPNIYFISEIRFKRALASTASITFCPMG